MPDDSVFKAQQIFDAWVSRGGKSKLRADVDIRLALKDSGPLQLLQIEKGDTGLPLSRSEKVEIFTDIMDAMIATKELRQRDFDDGLEAVSQISRIEGSQAGNKYLLLFLNDFRREPDKNKSAYRRLKSDVKKARKFVEMIELMRNIYFSRPKGSLASDPGTGWDEKKYKTTERKIAKLAREWLELNAEFLAPIFGFKSALEDELLAFMLALKKLSGGDEGASVSVVMTHRPRNRQPETRVLI